MVLGSWPTRERPVRVEWSRQDEFSWSASLLRSTNREGKRKRTQSSLAASLGYACKESLSRLLPIGITSSAIVQRHLACLVLRSFRRSRPKAEDEWRINDATAMWQTPTWCARLRDHADGVNKMKKDGVSVGGRSDNYRTVRHQSVGCLPAHGLASQAPRTRTRRWGTR